MVTAKNIRLDRTYSTLSMSNTVFFYNAKPSGQIEGELNPETNGGLYEYLREIVLYRPGKC